ncbi:MAG: phosphotriesterase [Anditalea sp.]
MKTIYFCVFLLLLCHGKIQAQEGMIMTVKGPIASSEIGLSLIHEHVMVDFIGADSTGDHRWERSEVIRVAQPYLEQVQKLGVNTFVECTPAYIGRDPLLLKELSDATGLHFITNTGYYGAADNKFLPPQAYSETADQLAERWIQEWENGIDGTGIKPGFIKTGVNNGPLSPLHIKLITAAARTHRKTGLVIASHTGPAIPAFEQLEILEREGVLPEAFIWVHAQSEKNKSLYVKAAQKGAWISLDGLNDSNIEDYLKMVKNLKEQGLLHKTLLSHDAGWYSPGEKNGGNFRGYTILFEKFIPLLVQEKFSEAEVKQLLITNPEKAFEIRIRKK